MTLRISLALKRKQIVDLVLELQKFIENYQVKPYVSRKREIDILCYTNLFFPPVIGILFVMCFFDNFEEIREEFKPDVLEYCTQHSLEERILILLFTFAYTLHFYVTSLLCITMFITIFEVYENALKQMLMETYKLLRKNISLRNLANASELILEAQKMHQKIEDVLSFSIFLAYVLVFVNFLNLVSVNTMTTTSPSIQFRAVACTLIFFWTTSSFIKLTLTGSKLIDICDLWKFLQKEIVRNCSRRRIKNQDQLTYFLLFLEESNVDLAFTGWGIFRLDRSLLLTISEALVSYSVLVATV
ncbi:uncharacterized protein CDAR_451561 [Caerostris darwini]|uniref:Gustatory receptor n=1 Tax=Caerostris darwini TaxID=1538125 RepID=A0AAV4UJM4_9ARAC|nr:uncharacterized protein CDAR_451561 [Caerostris darwini]